ncbi:hypothetical protein V6N13_064051 [Hibiscus sabdariffa]
MGDVMVGRYWCYICSRMVNPTVEPAIKCPICESGFVEEISSIRHFSRTNGIDSASTNNLSLLAPIPILLGIISGLGSSRSRITGGDQVDNNNSSQDAMDDELGIDFEALLMRRRTRRSPSALQVLEDTPNAVVSEPDNPENDRERRDRLILSDPFNDNALVVYASFGDYLMGHGWDLLLQYLSENDINHHGTPPALKEAIEAIPTVTVDDKLQCSVCLEDIEYADISCLGIVRRQRPMSPEMAKGELALPTHEVAEDSGTEYGLCLKFFCRILADVVTSFCSKMKKN